MRNEIHWSIGLAILVTLTSVLLYGANKPSVEVKAEDPKDVIIVEKETIVYEEPDNPRDYIKYVFGEDAPKAFLLLNGNDVCGGENKSLNPDAVNTFNSDGSRDYGLFQINSYWQKVQPKFLLDYKINTRIAYQLYLENGKTFKLWTAGRCMGI